MKTKLRLFGLTSPTLGITTAGSKLLISWPASGFVLQQSISLSSPNWLGTTNALVVTNGQSQVAAPCVGTNNFTG
jgi:hypothetical protein